jgi:hypothetical protein
MQTAPDLQTLRRKAADDYFANADLGNFEVSDTGPWTIDEQYWSRWVYGEDFETKKSHRFSFGVEFAQNSDKIIDSWQQE